MEDRRIITEPWATGLVGTIGVRLVSATGVEILARTTAGITEVPTGSGRYLKTVSVDPANYPIEHIWDSGGVFASGVITNQFTKQKVRDAVGGRWTNEDAETVDVTITDVP